MKITSAIADAQEAARRQRLREDGLRPLDAESEDALREYRFLREEESRKAQLPDPRPEPPPCERHPSWASHRAPGVPPPPRSMCQECVRDAERRRNPPRPVTVVVDTPQTRTTRSMRLASEKYAAKQGGLADPEPERGTRAWRFGGSARGAGVTARSSPMGRARKPRRSNVMRLAGLMSCARRTCAKGNVAREVLSSCSRVRLPGVITTLLTARLVEGASVATRSG